MRNVTSLGIRSVVAGSIGLLGVAGLGAWIAFNGVTRGLAWVAPDAEIPDVELEPSCPRPFDVAMDYIEGVNNRWNRRRQL